MRINQPLLAAIAITVSACGGNDGPSAPTSHTSIQGTWNGTITFTKPVARIVQTTWQFSPMANSSGLGFEARASWNGITTRALTATVIGSQFSADGVYTSPLGCDGIVGSNGTADPRVIDATFNGSSSCDSVFEGHLTLTR